MQIHLTRAYICTYATPHIAWTPMRSRSVPQKPLCMLDRLKTCTRAVILWSNMNPRRIIYFTTSNKPRFHRMQSNAMADKGYKQLPQTEESPYVPRSLQRERLRTHGRVFCCSLACASVIFLLMGAMWHLFPPKGPRGLAQSSSASTCHQRLLRREWRSLHSDQQVDYIKALKCLNVKPSMFRDASNGSLYDDFEWVHVKVGYSGR